MKKWVPLWVKEPIYEFVVCAKKQPLKIAISHALCNYAENRNYTNEKKFMFYKSCHLAISNYLETKYKKSLILQASKYTIGAQVENAPIWVFWWQGMDFAPEIVRICVESIRKNAGEHEVIVVDAQNYRNYVQLPPYIEEKRERGIISLTHFSDILRANLIAEHGGFWMDATIFCTKQIDENVFRYPIYTCRNPGKEYRNVSEWNWTGYAICGWRNNMLFCLLRDFFNLYWRDHDYLIDYFLIDYAIKLIFDQFESIREQICRIPKNNCGIYDLVRCFDMAYEPKEYEKLMKSDTWMHKLTWKKQYKVKTDHGQETMYSMWKSLNTFDKKEE